MIVFLTNYLNIHQLDFSLEMYKRLGNDFCYISMSGITNERKKLGFDDLDVEYSFVLRAYDGIEEYDRAMNLIMNCDILIAGSVEDRLLLQRLKKDKITVRYCERFFKRGTGLRAFLSSLRHLRPFMKYDKFYFLCNSAFTPLDINKYNRFQNKPYKWGYFPEKKQYENVVDLFRKKEVHSILWCGRMVDWKHPEVPIEVAKGLKSKGLHFKLTIIGSGEMKSNIDSLVDKYNLYDCVNILGSLPPQTVRRYMERSEIFLFTSDRNEGWGAVLNESMNSGCAVIASHEIGAVPYLICNGVNGLIYRNGDMEDLISKVIMLLQESAKRKQMAINAYRTIDEVWNGSEAAKRLLLLIDNLLKGIKRTPFTDGPCSYAPIIYDDWISRDEKVFN